MGADLVKDVEEALIETAKEVVCSDVYSFILNNILFFIQTAIFDIICVFSCVRLNCLCFSIYFVTFYLFVRAVSLYSKILLKLSLIPHKNAQILTRMYLHIQLGGKTKEIYRERIKKFKAPFSCDEE